MNDFIRNNLVYPEKALKANIEGEVIVQFIISKDGIPKDFIIQSGLSFECDQAALNVLKKMPKWKPAFFYSGPVDLPQSISIQFGISR